MSNYDDDGEAEDDEVFTGKYEGGRNERNERHGFGKTVLPNKDIYEGNYMNGKRDGCGIYKFLSKAAKRARYAGEYYQGRKQGFGTFVYPDGSRYEGNWVNDMKDGTGTYYYVNGDTYEGDWFHDARHGNGTYTFRVTSLKYIGAWHKGKIHGYGTYVYPHYKYSGRFRSNKAFGQGKFVFDAGCELHGKYTLERKDGPVFSDIEQEAALMAIERALVGGGEDDEQVNLEEIVIPGTPPPIEGEVTWKFGTISGLHFMTEEEAEEMRLMEELRQLRIKLEAQLEEMKEAEKKKAEQDAAHQARVEAERAALENMAQELDLGEEGEVGVMEAEGEGDEGGKEEKGGEEGEKGEGEEGEKGEGEEGEGGGEKDEEAPGGD